MTIDYVKQLKTVLDLPEFDPIPHMLEMVPSDRALQPAPTNARISAVMLLLYEKDAQLTIVLAKRPQTLKNHPGQIAFPGGRQDPPETLEQTALRETWEEVGIPAEQIEVVGTLHQMYVPPSNFIVNPFVGWFAGAPQFKPSAAEVEKILEVPIRHFQDRSIRGMADREFKGTTVHIPFYWVEGEQVWGATATILCELAARLDHFEQLRSTTL